mmetsp:Transcript_16590/g.51455  ORF Transcript_16590/g.51455 Transcript_16590/m.51455 type:complete len:202 (-) Transcript_16590:37-642(-)
MLVRIPQHVNESLGITVAAPNDLFHLRRLAVFGAGSGAERHAQLRLQMLKDACALHVDGERACGRRVAGRRWRCFRRRLLGSLYFSPQVLPVRDADAGGVERIGAVLGHPPHFARHLWVCARSEGVSNGPCVRVRDVTAAAARVCQALDDTAEEGGRLRVGHAPTCEVRRARPGEGAEMSTEHVAVRKPCRGTSAARGRWL